MNTEGFFCRTPAKINLFFDVLRRLDSGYHEIESLVAGVSLYDTLHVRPADVVRLAVRIPPGGRFQRVFAGTEIPNDERNLVVRAARLLQEIAAQKLEKLPCADIILTKRIPSEAGLGGGSSDAAAALGLLNRLWKLNLTREELIAAGATLGCDVPLFLHPLPVVCRGRGEILEEVPHGETLPEIPLVLLYPPVGLSTAKVYQACVPRDVEPVGAGAVRPEPGETIARMLAAWRKNDLAEFSRHLFNRLHAAARSLSPWISEIESAFQTLTDPCVGFSMTGSGTAFFGLCRDTQHARNVARQLKQRKIGEVFIVHTSSTLHILT